MSAETKKTESECERAYTDLVDLLYKHLLERKEKVRVMVSIILKAQQKPTQIRNKKEVQNNTTAVISKS